MRTLVVESTTLIQSMSDFLPKKQEFGEIVSPILNNPLVSNTIFKRRFESHFGLYPKLCAELSDNAKDSLIIRL